MENATQQDALESEEVVEQPVEEESAKESTERPLSAREKALEDIYEQRAEQIEGGNS